MTTEKPLVRFENVQKSYDGEILVVKDLKIDVILRKQLLI